MKKLPPALVCGLAIRIVAALGLGVARLLTSADSFPVRFFLASDGLYVAADVLALVGFLELASRTSGRVRTGLNIAAVASALGLLDTVFWLCVDYFQPHGSWIGTLGEYTWFALALMLVAGVAVAASVRSPKAAIAGILVELVCNPVPPLANRMWHGLSSYKLSISLMHGLQLAQAITVVVLVMFAADDREPARSPQAAVDGLRVIASALWLRVIAAVGVAGLTLLLMLGHAGEGALGVLKLAMISGAVINLISLAMLARGAIGVLGAAVAELPSWPIAACAAGTLWCLGVALHQLPYTYRMLYGSHESDSFGFLPDAQQYVQALALAVPLVATAAIAVIATAIAGFASRRGLEQLRAEAQGKGFGFVALMLGTVAVQQWLVPKADSLGGFAFMTLLAAGAGLAATVMMARLCTRAADSVHAEPGLPTATLRA